MTAAMGVLGKNRSEDYPENLLTPYRTLFKNSDQYIRIVEALSKKRKGLTRTEISAQTKIPSNGALSKMLSDLMNAGFIRINPGYNHKSRDMLYQLSDYYTKFFFSFVRENSGRNIHLWSETNDDRRRSTWQGFTFEQVCKDHVEQIKKGLGIEAVRSEISSWLKKGDDMGSFLFGGSDVIMVFQKGVNVELLTTPDGEGGYEHILMGEPYAKLVVNK